MKGVREVCHITMVPPLALTLSMEIFRVEMSIVIAKEEAKEEVEITRVKHGLTEENKHGFVELSKISQGVVVSGETLYIPGENWKTFKRFCFRT